MYHRVFFNLYTMVMIAIDAFGKNAHDPEASKEERKLLISFHFWVTIVWMVAVITNRPYRCLSTNLMYILGMGGFT